MDVKNTAISVADPFVRHLIAQYLKRRDEELSVLNSLLAEDDFEARFWKSDLGLPVTTECTAFKKENTGVPPRTSPPRNSHCAKSGL